jgi:hypothetical protein
MRHWLSMEIRKKKSYPQAQWKLCSAHKRIHLIRLSYSIISIKTTTTSTVTFPSHWFMMIHPWEALMSCLLMNA